MKFSVPIVICRTVTRASTMSQLFSHLILYVKCYAYFVYLFNVVLLWLCADRVYFTIVVAVDVFMLLELVYFFWLLLLTYIVFNFFHVIFIDNHQLIEKE